MNQTGVQDEAYLNALRKQKERERQKKRRGRNKYNFPEEDDDIKNDNNDYSDDDGYSGNRGRKPDPFSNADGPRKNAPRNDPFANQRRYDDDDDDYQQPQRTRGDPFGGQGQQRGSPQGRGSSRKDPFSRKRGFNDDDDDDY